MAAQFPGNDAPPGFAGGEDVRERLRRDHEALLAQVDRLRGQNEATRALRELRALRRSWVIHALAEETVVYAALEPADIASTGDARAGERFVEHEIVEELFAKMDRVRAATVEWRARLNVARDLIARHIDSEHDLLFPRIERRFDASERAELARRFALARDKLTLLEEAKAA